MDNSMVCSMTFFGIQTGSCKYLYEWLHVIRLSTLEKQGRTDIGQYFVKFSGSPFLKSGITLAIFISSGKIQFSSDRLNKCFRASLISLNHFLVTSKLIWSYSGLLLIFNEKKTSFSLFV